MSNTDYYIELTTPGEMLLELLEDNKIPRSRLAQKAGISETTLNLIIADKRKITEKTGRKISAALGMSQDYWVNMQEDYDLRMSKRARETDKIAMTPFSHPGRHLEIFLEDYLLTKHILAEFSGMSPQTITRIIAGTQKITVEIALRLSAVFGTSCNFWMNLQNRYDERAANQKLSAELAEIKARSAFLRERATGNAKKWNDDDV